MDCDRIDMHVLPTSSLDGVFAIVGSGQREGEEETRISSVPKGFVVRSASVSSWDFSAIGRLIGCTRRFRLQFLNAHYVNQGNVLRVLRNVIASFHADYDP